MTDTGQKICVGFSEDMAASLGGLKTSVLPQEVRLVADGVARDSCYVPICDKSLFGYFNPFLQCVLGELWGDKEGGHHGRHSSEGGHRGADTYSE